MAKRRRDLSEAPSDHTDSSFKRPRTEPSSEDEAAPDHEMGARDESQSRRGQRRVAEYGVVESLEMEDFMCHRKLKFEHFAPGVNFIIGHNGSGKSAALSALTIALGGKTLATGRATGLKGFVREGASRSSVTVKIKNQGPEAYRHEVYGNSIVIQRKFSKEGASSWKIMKADGTTTVSTKREELSAICDHMNIQVDNPLSVLTQDNSRMFLSSSSDKEKYKFFLSGTQLGKLRDEYKAVELNIAKTAKTLQVKQEALPDLKVKYDMTRAKWDEADKARKQKSKLEDLKAELAWSHVTSKQTEVDEATEQLETRQRRAEKLREEHEAAQAAFAEQTRAICALEAELANVDDEVIKDQRREVQAQIKENKTKLSRCGEDRRSINDSMNAIDAKIQNLDAQIASEEARLATNTQERRRSLETKKAVAQSDIDACEVELNDVITRRTDLQIQIKSAEGCSAELQRQLRDLQSRIQQCDAMISAAHKAVHDAYVPYGQNIKMVCEQISRAQWYGDRPIGPLGIHVKAKDPNVWGDLLRSQLANLLTSFVVTDPRDRSQLKSMLDKSRNSRINIIISKKDLFEFSHREPPAGILTVLRALEIDDPFVLRIFINQMHIETTLLSKDRAQLQNQLVSLRGGVGWSTGPNGWMQVRVFPEGGAHNVPLPRRSPHGLLLVGRDSSHEISRYQEDKARSQSECADLQGRIRETDGKVAQLRHELRALDAVERKSAQRKRMAQNTLKQVQEDMDEDFSSSLSLLQDERSDYVKEREGFEAQFKDIAERKAEIDNANKELQERSNRLRDELETYEERRKEIRNQIEAAAVLRVQKQSNVDNLDSRLKKANHEAETSQMRLDTAEVELKNFRDVALEVSPEVPNPRKTADIEKQIGRLNVALAQHRRRSGQSLEELQAAMERAEHLYTHAKEEYDNVAALNKALQKNLQQRQSHWLRQRASITERTEQEFERHMLTRGYFGRVVFDHEKETLRIEVGKDDQVRGEDDGSEDSDSDSESESGVGDRQLKEARALSGGEKSLSTICLLLALWDAINCPLRCLDEFDVFMDAVNRRISMKMMMDAAAQAVDKQYILITPQDMGKVTITDDVKVHRMHDPQRSGGQLRAGAAPSNA